MSLVTIGSDPEFGVLHPFDGRQLVAAKYFENSTSSPIGLDGHNHIGELRPRHADNPREHAENIRALVAQVDRRILDNGYDIIVTAGPMAGSDPMGGHIHFGNLGCGFSRDYAASVLDYLLCVPISLIQDPGSAQRRRSGDYGRLSDWREVTWGMEYRVPASWLVGFGVALSILSLGYVIVDALKQGHKPKLAKQDIHFRSAYEDCDQRKLRENLARIRKEWRELPLYSKFRLEIAYLNHLITNEMLWLENQDFRRMWLVDHDKRKKRMEGFKIVGNPNDKYCQNIANLVGKGAKNISVFVYGLSPDRDIDIAINNEDLASLLKSQYPSQEIDYGTYGSVSDTSSKYARWLCIGLSLDIRARVNDAASIINFVLGIVDGQDAPSPDRDDVDPSGQMRIPF